MKRQTNYPFFILLLLCVTFTVQAQDLKEAISTKQKALQTLIKKAEKKGIDVTKEKSTIRTAEICGQFADWDEKNIDRNEALFKKVKRYKEEARKTAEELPTFERNEILLMLEEGEERLSLALKGKISKQEVPIIDWSKTEIVGDDVMYNGQPVFLADYSWKPKTDYLTEYHGNLDGIFISTRFLEDEEGTLKKRFKQELINQPSGRIGTAFINHLSPPEWFTEKYPEASIGKRRYFDYDIDHPASRELVSLLFKEVVPHIKGKKYSSLGYMLANEPHWHTKAKSWDTGTVSDYTLAKFRNYLKEKHQTISALNQVWETNYADFKSVKVTIPMAGELQGTAIWYDWMRFNQLRGVEWFQFLSDEIHKYDPEGNTHIKIMPHLFSENTRDHGIDLEALTALSTVIGNDAGAVYSDMWQKKEPEWASKYYFDWRQMCMGYDFMKSVSPEKLVFNSEGHFISTIRFRELKMKPEYARATYWLATMLGLDVIQTWFWPRGEDGSLRKNSKGYAASLTQMPRVLNEITLTYMDMNANASLLTKIQKLRKPIRVFHSETSAINIDNHMDKEYHAYERFLFEGRAVGFVTEGILNTQPHQDWDVVVIEETPFMTVGERDALQSYLDKGGKVVMDKKSVLKDEYGQPLTALNAGKGTLIIAQNSDEIQGKVLGLIAPTSLQISEENATSHKGCIWRYFEDEEKDKWVSIVNVGKTEATLKIALTEGQKDIQITDVITSETLQQTFKMQPLQVYFLNVGTDQKKGL
ncbi:beta-galactosidase [Flammeovirga sp. EKP202]|uniref:beta-galactosidase n=1 Tax=Flammeovirga sp. EKP202 TaxID=2770592 RepID=UPI00165F1080|nr:beta-galactosidase [Flammeovirga sp. EKP202]MBD0401974.1 beta-galactosidase [Flammeovirga sp. EKP202]